MQTQVQHDARVGARTRREETKCDSTALGLPESRLMPMRERARLRWEMAASYDASARQRRGMKAEQSDCTEALERDSTAATVWKPSSKSSDSLSFFFSLLSCCWTEVKSSVNEAKAF